MAGVLASALAGGRIKTLIFAQDRKGCEAIAKTVSAELSAQFGAVAMSADDQVLLTAIAEELGGHEFTFSVPERRAVSHHGLLLPLERQCNERLFRRSDGVYVLCATNTLAQGMNLPAEAVVIAGDDRFNPDSGRAERLEAHELLNAAGRAGRAGYRSQGVVLVIPGQVVPIDLENHKIGSRWIELQEELFSKNDHCLDIDDPLEALIDRISQGSVGGGLVEYLFCRLPVDADGTVSSRAHAMLGKSFAAYRARMRARPYVDQIDRVLAAARDRRSAHPAAPWQTAVGASMGVHPAITASICEGLSSRPPPRTVQEIADWTLDWMRVDLTYRGSAFFRDENLAAISRPPPETPSERSKWLMESIAQFAKLLPLWLSGRPLVELEKAIAPGKSLDKLVRAREFAINTIGDFAYAVGVVAQIARASEREAGTPAPTLAVTCAATCIREGVDHPAKLAMRYSLGKYPTRVAAHRMAAQLGDLDAFEGTTFAELRARVQAMSVT